MASKKEILDKLAAGEISAADAAQLLNQPEEMAETPKAAPAPTPAPQPEPMPQKATDGQGPSWFRVQVVNTETGKNKVSVNIPIHVLRLGLKIGGRFAPELQNLDWNELESLMQYLQTGLLVEVQDEESNEHVRVFIE
jgi:hypothetical protein